MSLTGMTTRSAPRRNLSATQTPTEPEESDLNEPVAMETENQSSSDQPYRVIQQVNINSLVLNSPQPQTLDPQVSVLTPGLSEFLHVVPISDLVKTNVVVTLRGTNWNDAEIDQLFIVVTITRDRLNLRQCVKGKWALLVTMTLPESSLVFALTEWGIEALSLENYQGCPVTFPPSINKKFTGNEVIPQNQTENPNDSLRAKRLESTIFPLKILFKLCPTEVNRIAPNGLIDYTTDACLTSRVPRHLANLPACQNGNPINILLCKFSSTRNNSTKAKGATLHITDFYQSRINYYYQLQVACQNLVELFRELTRQPDFITSIFSHWLIQILSAGERSLSTFHLDNSTSYINESLINFSNTIHSTELEPLPVPETIAALRQSLEFDMSDLLLSNNHMVCNLTAKRQKLMHFPTQPMVMVPQSRRPQFQGWCINALQHKFLEGRRPCTKPNCVFEHRVPAVSSLNDAQKASMRMTINKMKNEEFKDKLLKSIVKLYFSSPSTSKIYLISFLRDSVHVMSFMFNLFLFL